MGSCCLADILSIGLGRWTGTSKSLRSFTLDTPDLPPIQLLSSPTFHRGVAKVAKTVHKIQHGTPMEELGGTKLEREHEPTASPTPSLTRS